MDDTKRQDDPTDTDHARATRGDAPRKALRDQIEELFTYHPPTSGQQIKYEQVRDHAKYFARVLVENTPPGADQTAAIRKLRECVMTANAAIALDGKL